MEEEGEVLVYIGREVCGNVRQGAMKAVFKWLFVVVGEPLKARRLDTGWCVWVSELLLTWQHACLFFFSK